VEKPPDKAGFVINYDVRSDPKYRANAGGTTVRLAETNKARTVAHEIGHCLEDQITDLVKREKEFLEHRAPGEVRKNLGALFPTHGYKPDEEGVEDEFSKYFSGTGSFGQFDDSAAIYVGKHYVNRSELLTMGIEALYVDPARFADKDPEFFKFVIGLLKGAFQ